MAEDKIYKMIAVDKLKRVAMAKYFGRMTEDERIEAVRFALDLSKQYIDKIDESMKGKPEYFYAMLNLALWKMNWIRDDLSRKNHKLTDKQAKEINERRLSSIFSARKDRVKRGKLRCVLEVRLFHVIRTLRNEGVSWRECAGYLQKYHHVRISYVHLHKLFLKITSEKIKRGEKNEI
jgi:hypothetical protein